jgi:hypothetical protein
MKNRPPTTAKKYPNSLGAGSPDDSIGNDSGQVVFLISINMHGYKKDTLFL